MKTLTSANIRQMYIDFFKEKGHKVEPSASLIPHEDPSLLWINSGVATLKKYFDGRVVPDNPRIVNAQKSIRTNDIENVGKTARHHTFFEMLGNFSVGDYFKREAIHWAWEFLTSEEWLGINEDKLAVTIHPEDDEAHDIWHTEIGIPEAKIIRLEENFWDIGEGPSGPNTEVFFDRGEKYGNDPNDPELFPGGENERHLEIWNLVFSQFNHNPDGSYTPLPKKNIDTGMGLERVVCALQDTPTNYETDLFMPMIKATEKISGMDYGENNAHDTAFKVVADHIRTVTFAVADGALPSNEGRGYVLRRLVRRAIRFAKQLNLSNPFMYELVPIVANVMRAYYPNVPENVEFIQKVIKNEEERFHETINDGLAILSEMIESAKANGSMELPGADAFKLYDTYGFPFELTKEYVEEIGMTVNQEQFKIEMNAQRVRARSARQDTGSMQVQTPVLSDIQVKSEFIGYENLHTTTSVSVIVKNGEIILEASAGDEVLVVLDQTPFYAESGGQIADKGTLANERVQAVVKDVQKAPNGQHLHTVLVEKGIMRKEDKLKAVVEPKSRAGIVKNHTATHLLHQALKDVLGTHVNQAGSLVSPDRLRFDFSHFNQLTTEELATIESSVNQKIWDTIMVKKMVKPIEEAKAMGAMALFGEKYGNIVRVVQVGEYSLELCGGCHVTNTAEIGLFKIVSESGIGAGTRRIEAVTSEGAYRYLIEQVGILQNIADQFKSSLTDVPSKVENVQAQIRGLQRENESLKAKLATIEAGTLTDHAKDVNGVKVLVKKIDANEMNNLRSIVDDLKNKLKSGIVVLGSVQNEKVNIVAGVTSDLTKEGFHAGNIVKEVASRCGGGGGGRPDMAQAGGKQPEQLDEALNYVYELVKSIS